ncbi:glycoside hydrolase clan GH-D [Catenulispora acidiphila DSM 44928]|uniref:Alpha-galactosidase n=1 Tax=Catenulispora acidiphila (strain DSM 44928 / JCM 14897 / NBRC 102108 / NRRL B-24433 / ID139908) TaxID=479433 RepID=C7PXL7_CATAD|nr:alpha-galactosidase [Catenulispora acidiphila]ACU71470.1 glycoside hydrolase clan GH-D [Catenulispora acidiphila DSM 44928]
MRVPPQPVVHDPARGLWLLSTPGSRYLLREDPDGSPRHVAWGSPEAVHACAPTAPASSFDGDGAADELGIETGARFGPAGLQVRFADGTRGAQWTGAGHEIDGGHLVIRLRDRRYPLRAELHYRVRPDTDVIERWTVLANDGEAPITVGRLDSAAWTIPHLTDYRMSHLVGGWNHEFQLRRTQVPVAETVFTSRRGLTSHHANPWLAVDDGTAEEDRGSVWSTALAWSGSWRVTVHRDPADRVTWTGGFGHEGITWTLGPDQSLETPVFAGLHTVGGFGGAARAWHDYLRRYVIPAPAEDRPVVYNSWEATGFAVDEAGQLRLAETAAQLGVELFVLDDGWFGGRRDDTAGLGDWRPYPGAFPHGLGPLVQKVHQLGMRFGLWVEPEMVNADSDLFREYPDWVVHTPQRDATELRQQLMLNYGREDVAQWAHQWLDQLVREHGIDFLKWDANRAVTDAGWPGHPDPDRLWIDHTRAVYRIMDRLRADHPQLRIEACAGGGGRADIGVLARTDQVWTSDNTDPVDRLAIQNGFSMLFPAEVMAAWVTDSPNIATGRSTPLRFRFHVSMAGALGIGGKLTEWTREELAEAAELVAVYKRVRGVVQHGVLYRPATDGHTAAVHYASEGGEGGEGGDEHVVIAWRAATAVGLPGPLVRLTALDPDAEYYDVDRQVRITGAAARAGLRLDLPRGDYASALYHLRRV